MNHPINCQQIDPFLNGLLPPADQERFKQHLLACPSCTEVIEQQRQVDALLQEAWANVNCPASLQQFVANALGETKRSDTSKHDLSERKMKYKDRHWHRIRNAWPVCMALATTTLLIVSSLFVWSAGSSPNDPPSNQVATSNSQRETRAPSLEKAQAAETHDEEPAVIFLASESETTLLQPLPETGQNFTVVRAYKITQSN